MVLVVSVLCLVLWSLIAGNLGMKNPGWFIRTAGEFGLGSLCVEFILARWEMEAIVAHRYSGRGVVTREFWQGVLAGEF